MSPALGVILLVAAAGSTIEGELILRWVVPEWIWTDCALPSRNTLRLSTSPAWTLATSRVSSEAEPTAWPLTATTTSPARTPPFSAGPAGTTPATTAPLRLVRPQELAISGFRSWMVAPI